MSVLHPLRLVTPALLAAVSLWLFLGNPLDRDGDGVGGSWGHRLDCDDRSPTVYPGAPDIPLNARDEDCDGLDSARGSNVILITLDALRAGHLGSYGYPRDTSPNIDKIASEGVLFTNAFSQSSWTIPSLASLLTSMYPGQHGAHHSVKGASGLSQNVPLVTDVLKNAGYETAAFLSSAYPLLELGFSRSFDLYGTDAETNTRTIRKWMRERRHRKFFVWLHYFKPHIPYFPSYRSDGLFVKEHVREYRHIARYWEKEECNDRYVNTPEQARIRMAFYDECIRDSDDRVGEVMDELEQLHLVGKTLVIVSSDHGEEFFEHGGCDHGQTLYDEVIHVPLIMRHPAVIGRGTVREAQVRIIDIAPTIIDMLELGGGEEFRGRSLLEHIRGEDRDRPVFGGYLIHGERAVALRQNGFKFIYFPSTRIEEFYDLRIDSEERRNLLRTMDPRVKRFRQRIGKWIDRTKTKYSPRAVEFDEETIKKLKSLGYVTSGGPMGQSKGGG